MNKIICRKCGDEISNESGAMLTFCPNCGASLTNLSKEKPLSSKKYPPTQSPTIKRQFPVILLTSLLTAFFLSVFFAAGLYFYLPQKADLSSGGIPKQPEKSAPRRKLSGSVSASEVSKITYSTWQHNGLLYSGDGYVQSNQITFSNDGTAVQNSLKNYDDGKRTDETAVSDASITADQFQRLAEIIAENDFFNEPDSIERISERDATLTVNYSGGVKAVKTSNTAKDTPEIKAILQVFDNLRNQINWKKQ